MIGTSWLLGAGNPWHTAGADALSVGPEAQAAIANPRNGLELASLAEGPLGLNSSDDSLGRLVLPRGIAVAGDSVFVLSEDGGLVYRYDPLHQTLDALAYIGTQGLCEPHDVAAFKEPRRFRHASAIAVLDDTLYVADPRAQRVQVFDLKTLALLRLHDSMDAPVDIACGADAVFILDRGRGRVYQAMPHRDALTLAIDPGENDAANDLAGSLRARHWDRIAVDRQGLVYLRFKCGDRIELDVFDLSLCLPAQHACERVFDSTQVRDRFDPPAIFMDTSGVLELPDRLLDPCGLRRKIADGVPRWDVADRLYVADPQSRSLLVFLSDGRLRHRFGPLDANGDAVQAESADAWSVTDMAVVDGMAVILDARHQFVYTHRHGESAPRLWFAAPADADRRWTRIAVDASGCLLLWDGVEDLVDRYSPQGRAIAVVALRTLRPLFKRVPSTRQPASDRGAVVLTRGGVRPQPRDATPVWPQPRYATRGVWTSEWLDSGMHDCAWHMIELAFGQLPPGSSVLVRTRTSNDAQTPQEVAASLETVSALGSWNDTRAFIADPQPDPKAPAGFDPDLLVPSGAGRYLQLQIVLTGNGLSTPVVKQLRLRFPRESLLQYLPAIYSSPPEQQAFLDNFLSIAQTTWSAIERQLDDFDRYLDPDSVPPEALGYLAGWLDLPLEGTWTAEQNRRLVQAMPRLRATWGTVEGLRAWVRVYLATLGALAEEDLEALGVPAIVETFVERRRLLLNADSATLGSAQALWSPAVERRFQLGVFDRVGDVELVSTGQPHTDVFARYAHSFRIYVPSALIRNADDEAIVRRAIDMQKPAHVTYELVLVEPRMRIGEQSTIELDTVIGAPHPGPLPCPATSDAPSRPPRGRLGFDTTLGPQLSHAGNAPPVHSLA